MVVRINRNDDTRTRTRLGFTLAEVLIVVAIIAVLATIAIPLFLHQTEKAREATDLANARSAYSEVMIAALSNDASLKKSNGDYMRVVPLEQLEGGWVTDVSDMTIGGISSSDWIGAPQAGGMCTVILPSNSATPVINWNGSEFEDDSLMELKEIPNEERVAADQKVIRLLGQEILNQGWSVSELRANLGIAPKTTGNTLRIANYYQLKSGSFSGNYTSAGFKITSNSSGKLDELLRDAGYYGGEIMSSETVGAETTTTYTNSLFFSDELTANNFGNYPIDETMRAIIIKVTEEKNGKITGMTIYTKAMDDQANLNDAQKKKFSINVP